MEEAQLTERILEIFDDLTRAERLLAEHFLENPDSISLNTAQEISQLAMAGLTTVIWSFTTLNQPISLMQPIAISLFLILIRVRPRIALQPQCRLISAQPTRSRNCR